MTATASPRPRFGLSSFVLHIAAMLFMLCDHLWATFFFDASPMAYIGRLAFPLFAFMLAEGFHHTSDVKKYLKRMLIFAVISEIPFNLMIGGSFFYPLHQNVLITFLLSILAMMMLQKMRERPLLHRCIFYPLIVLSAVLLGFLTFCDYYGYGVLTVLLFYFTRTDRDTPLPKRLLMMLIQLIVMVIINCELLGGLILPFELFGHSIEITTQSAALLTLPIIWLYNGAQGPYNKAIRYLYYGFYPAHLLVIGGVALILSL